MDTKTQTVSPTVGKPEPDKSSNLESREYLGHLVHVGARKNTVVAAEDIYNQFGVLLIKEGAPLSSNIAAKLENHRFDKAIDDVLLLSKRLSNEQLLEKITGFLNKHPDLHAVHSQNDFNGALRHLCLAKDIPPALMQKLTVMEECLPEVFNRALFCAWLAAVIATVRKLPTEDIYLSFLAGLLHDAGLLHINKEIVSKSGDYNGPEWRAIQSHVITGQRLIDNYPQYPRRLGIAILEHHERTDGAGFPTGKSGNSLEPIGQIIALADMLHSLRFRESNQKAESLQECMPFLRVNTGSYTEENYSAISKILRHAKLKPGGLESGESKPPPSTSELAKKVSEANNCVIEIVQALNSAQEPIAALQQNKSVTSIQRLILQIRKVVQSSGATMEDLATWLQAASNDSSTETAQELKDLYTTYHEILWLTKRIERHIGEMTADAESLAELQSQLQQQLEIGWALYND